MNSRRRMRDTMRQVDDEYSLPTDVSDEAGFFFVEVDLVEFIYTQGIYQDTGLGRCPKVLVPKILRESCPTGKTDGGESVKSSTSKFPSLSFPFHTNRRQRRGVFARRARTRRWMSLGGCYRYRGTKTLVLPTGLWCFRCATARLLDPIPPEVRSFFFFLTQFCGVHRGRIRYSNSAKERR